MKLMKRYRKAMTTFGRDPGDDIPDEVLARRLNDVAEGMGITLEQLVATIESKARIKRTTARNN